MYVQAHARYTRLLCEFTTASPPCPPPPPLGFIHILLQQPNRLRAPAKKINKKYPAATEEAAADLGAPAAAFMCLRGWVGGAALKAVGQKQPHDSIRSRPPSFPACACDKAA